MDSLRSRHRFEVATWVSLESVATWNFEVAIGLEALRGGLRSRHHFLGRDMGGNKGGRDKEKWRRGVAEMGLC